MHARSSRQSADRRSAAHSVAPVHRGPQAMAHGETTSSLTHHAPNAALLIDFDNVTMGIQKDLHSELRNLLSSDIIRGKVAVQRAYADWRRYPGYIVPLTEASIDLIWAPAYGSAKKNATDIRLAVDAIELVFTRAEIGTFILLSGDSDFSSLVIKLKEYGKYVIGVGIRESSSDLLVQNCDEYYSYNALAGLVKTGEEEVVKWDPWELVTEAISRMTKNGDVMRSDRLKQVMQEIDPAFEEKNVGFSKFSRFVQEAVGKGLLRVTKLENGQLEVGGVKEAFPLPADATERDRRGRRGRGGRAMNGDSAPERPSGSNPRFPSRHGRFLSARSDERATA
ncbi:MAG TPA: NYN domain-containing protein [Gemmatimonadaceae bacterium]|nr:NYN domain-containing protein [Gemmatimonadaceae bacterium]